MTGRDILVFGCVVATAFAGVNASFANEQPKYDRKIEAAAIEILQTKIGGFRGGFDLEDRTKLITPKQPTVLDITNPLGELRTSG